MKTALLALLTFSLNALGQNFSETTNTLRLNMAQPVAGTTLPTINWVTPRLERTNSLEKSVVFEAIVSSDVPLKSVWLELTTSDRTVPRRFPIGEAQYSAKVTQPVGLMEGENIVRLFAENIKGGLVSSVRSILTGKDALEDAIDINRKDIALIFATDEYDHLDDLVNPIFDGRTIEGLLKDKYGFQTEMVENATNDQILAKITEYNLKKFNPQDQLFVFFAGHGIFDEALGEGYVVASNSLRDDPGRASYVSHVLIRERLNNVRCEHIFLMMDVCFGGTLDPVLASVRSEMSDETIDKQFMVKKLTKRTRKYLTSGSKEYVPDGERGKHSPFAEKFILALREIGGGTGRILSLDELRPYFLRLSTETRFGSFHKSDDTASDFVFVAKQ